MMIRVQSWLAYVSKIRRGLLGGIGVDDLDVLEALSRLLGLFPCVPVRKLVGSTLPTPQRHASVSCSSNRRLRVAFLERLVLAEANVLLKYF